MHAGCSPHKDSGEFTGLKEPGFHLLNRGPTSLQLSLLRRDFFLILATVTVLVKPAVTLHLSMDAFVAFSYPIQGSLTYFKIMEFKFYASTKTFKCLEF
jgi:hypothetical protein